MSIEVIYKMLINNMDSVKLIEGKDGYSKKRVRI